MSATLLVNNFAAGELSPRMMGAVGTPAYAAGCQTLENMIPRASGAMKRPGTYYMGTTLSNADAVLVSYIDDLGAKWMLEFTAAKIRAWNVSTHTIGAANVTTPYAAGEIRSLRFAQDKTNLYIFHKSYAPRILTTSSGVFQALTTPTFIGAEWPVTAVDIAADTLTMLGCDRLALNQAVTLRTLGSMPSPLVAGTTYYVKAITPTPIANTLETRYAVTLSASQGGTLIDITTTGSGMLYLADPSAVPFNASGKYPSAGAFHMGRLYLVVPPNDIWASRVFDAATGTDRFTDFTLGTAADKGIHIREIDMGSSQVYWLASHTGLVAGSEFSEWASGTDVPTPANFDLALAAPNGCADVQGIVAGDGVAYVRAGGRQVALMRYSSAYQASQSSVGSPPVQSIDLTEGADHIGLSPFKQIDFQSVPDPILWAVRTDGTLCSCSLRLASGVLGWARHPMLMTGGLASVESICVTRGPIEDELWLVVNRGGTRTVEWMAPHYTAAQTGQHYVDCGTAGTQTAAVDVTIGDSHLNGASVECLGDGAVLPPVTAASGKATYSRTVTIFHIGYRIASRLLPTRVELGAQGSITQGKKKRVVSYLIRLYRSLGGKVGPTYARAEALLTRDPSTPLGTAQPLFSGDIQRAFPGALDEAADILIAHDDPAPFEVLAVMPSVEVVEK